MTEEDRSHQESVSRRKGMDLAILTSIIAALIAFVSSIVVTYIQQNNNLKVEEKKHESSLIDKAINGGDLETTKKLFKFYLDTGLLTDPGGKIKAYLKNGENIPTIPLKGSIACYSHNEENSAYPVGSQIYVMGIIDGLKGRYNGRIFQPEGHENEDISALQEFKDQCNSRFPACKRGCWAGGDTGGFYGYK
jgi:hypothetical protein